MLILHQNLLRQILIDKNDKRSSIWFKLFKGPKSNFKKRHSLIISYFNNHFPDLNEAFIILRDNMKEYPKCKICGKPTYYHNGLFKEYCCNSCAAKGRNQNERLKRNIIKPQKIYDYSDVINYKRYDDVIKKLFIDKTCRGNRTSLYWKFIGSPTYLNKYMNIKSYFFYRYKDISQELILNADFCNEVFLRLENNIEERAKCPICGKPVGYCVKYNYYMNYCGRSCKMKDPKTQEHIHNVSNEKYGSINNANQISESWQAHTPEQNALGIQHRRETNIANGHDSNWVNTEQMMITTFERFGTVCSLLHPEVHQKVVDFYMNTYGVEHQSQVPEIIKKITISNIKTAANKKGITLTDEEIEEYINERERLINETEDISKTAKNPSKQEIKSYKFIKTIFKDTIHGYQDERYSNPINGKQFHCDIYIPSKDVFIECQYFPSHGRHPFNINADESIECDFIFNHYKLRDYREDVRLYVFTISDPMKRQVAKEHNLNYFELWKGTQVEMIELCKKIKKLPDIK